jgi:hypothetical protein
MVWSDDSSPGNDEVRLKAVRVASEDGHSPSIFSSSRNIYVEIRFISKTTHSALCVGFDLLSSDGHVLARSYQTDLPAEEWPKVRIGENRWWCQIPKGLLNGGVYYISPKIGMHAMYWIVNLDATVRFEVLLDHGVSPFWNVLDKSGRPGAVAPIFKWHARTVAK